MFSFVELFLVVLVTIPILKSLRALSGILCDLGFTLTTYYEGLGGLIAIAYAYFILGNYPIFIIEVVITLILLFAFSMILGRKIKNIADAFLIGFLTPYLALFVTIVISGFSLTFIIFSIRYAHTEIIALFNGVFAITGALVAKE